MIESTKRFPKDPSTRHLPSVLAELIGTDLAADNDGTRLVPIPSGLPVGLFDPLNDRNHSRIAVQRCSELGLMGEYGLNLSKELKHPYAWNRSIWNPCEVNKHKLYVRADLLNATPAQESRAAYATLRTYHEAP